MNESNINQVIKDINNYFLDKYGNVNFSFWLSGDVFFEYNCNNLIFAASTTKLAYGLFFIAELEDNKIFLDTKLDIVWDTPTLKQLYKKIIKKEKVDPYINRIYALLTKNEKKFLKKILSVENEDNFSADTLRNISKNINKNIHFKTLLELIFAKSSNKALELIVNYYKNNNIILQDEVQKIVDNVLGKNNLTVINNSYKEKTKKTWNVSTLKELIDIFSIYLNKSDNYILFKKCLNTVSNKYIEWNTIYEPILFEKSGWFPDYPISDDVYKQDILFNELKLEKYKYATFINCVSFNPIKSRYIGYSLCLGHDDAVGNNIIKSEVPLILERLVEFI